MILTILYTIFNRKGRPFVYFTLENGTPLEPTFKYEQVTKAGSFLVIFI